VAPLLSPMLVIPKESDSLWICVDFMKNSATTQKDRHVLPYKKKSSTKLPAMKCIPSLIGFHVIVQEADTKCDLWESCAARVDLFGEYFVAHKQSNDPFN
jgi:hypothetical protein